MLGINNKIYIIYVTESTTKKEEVDPDLITKVAHALGIVGAKESDVYVFKNYNYREQLNRIDTIKRNDTIEIIDRNIFDKQNTSHKETFRIEQDIINISNLINNLKTQSGTEDDIKYLNILLESKRSELPEIVLSSSNISNEAIDEPELISVVGDNGVLTGVDDIGSILIAGEISYTITNTSTAPIIFDTNAVTVSNQSNVIANVTQQPSPINPGQSTSFTVSITPIATGTIAFTVNISMLGMPNPVVFSVVGQGSVPVLTYEYSTDGSNFFDVDPDDNTDIGDMTFKTLTLRVNSANAASTITSINDNSNLVNNDSLPINIAANTFEDIIFTPTDIMNTNYAVTINIVVNGQTVEFNWVFDIYFELSDNFSSDLSQWTTYLPGAGDDISIVSGRMRFVSAIDAYATAFLTSGQILANWATITITFTVNQTSGVDCDFSAGLCMDNPADGEPNTFGSSYTVMQNGYSCLFRAGAFSERVGRFHNGSVSIMRDASEVTPAVDGTQKIITITFTKTVGTITIDRTYDGIAVGTQIVDSDADRKVGACYPFIAAYALGGAYVEIDDMSVVATA